jgi:hypothetical protein
LLRRTLTINKQLQNEHKATQRSSLTFLLAAVLALTVMGKNVGGGCWGETPKPITKKKGKWDGTSLTEVIGVTLQTQIDRRARALGFNSQKNTNDNNPFEVESD